MIIELEFDQSTFSLQVFLTTMILVWNIIIEKLTLISIHKINYILKKKDLPNKAAQNLTPHNGHLGI